MTIPNLISVMRLLLVPVIIAMIVSNAFAVAFALFVVAGVSDAIDGIIARRFAQNSELGGYLDPIADKALLVSIYLCLALIGQLPFWLMIVVVSRDLLIVGAVVLSWVMERPVKMRPLMVSKANTVAQIVLAAIVLGESALGVETHGVRPFIIATVACLTVVSTAAYLFNWLRHMADETAVPSADTDDAVSTHRPRRESRGRERVDG